MEAVHRPLSRPTRAIAVAIVAIVGVCGCAIAIDSVLAAQAEHRISTQIRPATVGMNAPLVTLGGFPYVSHAESERFPTLSVRIEQVVRPGIGPATVAVRADDVTVTGGVTDAGQSPSVRAGRVDIEVQITGDVLARALGLSSVALSSARDSSLAGGRESQAQVDAVDPQTGRSISGTVALRVADGRARLVPIPGPHGPAEPRLALALRPDLLPLDLPVSELSVKSGTITALGSTPERTVNLSSLGRSREG